MNAIPSKLCHTMQDADQTLYKTVVIVDVHSNITNPYT